MTWRTQLFASYDAWQAAGSPVGGIIPVEPAAYEMHPDHGFPWGDPWPAAARLAQKAGAVHYYVALPGGKDGRAGQIWCPWQRAFSKDKGYHGNGWTVTGQPEQLTAQPSIDTARYHGYLRGGILTDDLNGRTYDD